MVRPSAGVWDEHGGGAAQDQRRIRHLSAVLIRDLDGDPRPSTSRLPHLTLTPASTDPRDRPTEPKAGPSSPSPSPSRLLHSVDDADLAVIRTRRRRTPSSASFHSTGSSDGSLGGAGRRFHGESDDAVQGEGKSSKGRRRLSVATAESLEGARIEEEPYRSGEVTPKPERSRLSRRHTTFDPSLPSSTSQPSPQSYRLPPLPPFSRRTTAVQPDEDSVTTSTSENAKGHSERATRERLTDSFVCLSALIPSQPGSPSPASTRKGKSKAGYSEPHGPTPVPFFISPLSSGSMNPTFTVDPSNFVTADSAAGGDRTWTRETGVRVALWTRTRRKDTGMGGEGEEGAFRIAAEWDFDLADLIPLGRDTSAFSDLPPSPNRLIICLADDFYHLPIRSSSPLSPGLTSSPSSDDEGSEVAGYGSDPEGDMRRRKVLEARERRRERKRLVERSVRETRMVTSYSAGELSRLSSVRAELDDALRAAKVARETVDAWLDQSPSGSQLRRQVGEGDEDVKDLQRDIKAARAAVSERRDLLASRRKAVQNRREALSNAEALLGDLRVSASSERDVQASELAARGDIERMIRHRCAELVTALAGVYPIEPEAGEPGSLLFSINGVVLPNSVFVYPKVDEQGVATALGWTAALTVLLADYLSVPLHYPITVVGSRSYVTDPVSMIKGPRVFPLYAKGVDRYRFDYGVFLLNKNIEQIMYCRHLLVLDLRHTLPNLKHLVLATEPSPVVHGPLASSRSEPIASGSTDPESTASGSPSASSSSTSTDLEDTEMGDRSTTPSLTMSRSRASSRSEKTIRLPASNGTATPTKREGRGMNGDAASHAVEAS